jgi:ABC-type lipoprotein export system ATPase subunit
LDTKTFIQCNNLVKIYKVADLEVVALQGLDLEVMKGEIMALVGPSGSGKSTLLNVIGGLDTPSAGEVTVGDFDLLNMNDQQRVLYKRDVVGFVWQQPARNMLPYLTARENVELPLMLTEKRSKKRKERALELLDVLGITDRANFRPDRLSGGEQQLVALAIALANNPPLLLADELTGQIDSESAARVFDALREINKIFNTSVIVVTHDPQVAARVDRVVGIRDGRTSTEIRRQRNLKDGSMQEEEWVILDKTGRLQIPQVYVETLILEGRVKVRLEEDHISVWPALDGEQAGQVRIWRPDRSFEIDEASAKLPPIPELALSRYRLCAG